MTDELPQSGAPIPDDHHVLRYIAPRHFEDGVVNGAGFLRRPNEEGSSVNCLECFDPPVENQVSEVRSVARLRYAKTGCLVRLNIGVTRDYVRQNSPHGVDLHFVYDPLLAEADFPADPSHALIHGIPAAESAEAELIKDLIADCIIQPIYPTITQPVLDRG